MMETVFNSSDVRVHVGKDEGSCQGCRTKIHVYVIEAGHWQTRLCWSCLKSVYEQARKQ